MMEREPPGRQRIRDAAIILPFLATALLTPPLIRIFATPATPAGIPLIVLYIFAVWAAVIASAFVLARRLARPPSEPSSEEPPFDAG